MAWRSAWDERAWKRRYMRAFNAERRQRGLCVQCARISVRFRLCLRCRRKKQQWLAWDARRRDLTYAA